MNRNAWYLPNTEQIPRISVSIFQFLFVFAGISDPFVKVALSFYVLLLICREDVEEVMTCNLISAVRISKYMYVFANILGNHEVNEIAVEISLSTKPFKWRL